jgi:tetratricopeptide (TPR) repeat protein
MADHGRSKGASGGRRGNGPGGDRRTRSAGSGARRANAANSLYERYKDALRRGHVAALRNRLDAAIDAYGVAASIAPDRPLPQSAIGGILVRMERLPEALAAYDRAIALAPRDEAGLRGRADVLAALGRRVDAADTLDRLAEVLDAADRLPDASDAARRALELAESKDRRRHVASLAVRLRANEGDEAAERALAQVLRVLEPPVAPLPEFGEVPVDGAEPVTASSESEPEPEPEPEPIDAAAVGAAAEAALYAGDADAAREGFLVAAAAHRAAGRSVAAIDACYLALAVAPADVDLHLLLAELYLERGWRVPAIDKLLLLGRLASLADDDSIRQRVCALAGERLAGEPRLAELCA